MYHGHVSILKWLVTLNLPLSIGLARPAEAKCLSTLKTEERAYSLVLALASKNQGMFDYLWNEMGVLWEHHSFLKIAENAFDLGINYKIVFG